MHFGQAFVAGQVGFGRWAWNTFVSLNLFRSPKALVSGGLDANETVTTEIQELAVPRQDNDLEGQSAYAIPIVLP